MTQKFSLVTDYTVATLSSVYVVVHHKLFLLLHKIFLVCRSLVATNDHLLKELEEAKRRHKLELQQSHSNYEQLRQTVNLIQET